MDRIDKINATQGRLKQAYDKGLGKIVKEDISRTITKTVDNTAIRIGEVTKFYPYLDKVKVRLKDGNEVLCKILHRFGGDIIDYYTPIGDEEFCETLKEPCIIPFSGIDCLIVNIHDKDSDEYLLLGFFESEELVGINPAKQGNVKIVTRGGANQFWIKFGYDGLDLRLPDSITTNVGEMDEEMTENEFADSDNVYTKEEIDKMLQDLRDELNHGS